MCAWLYWVEGQGQVLLECRECCHCLRIHLQQHQGTWHGVDARAPVLMRLVMLQGSPRCLLCGKALLQCYECRLRLR